MIFSSQRCNHYSILYISTLSGIFGTGGNRGTTAAGHCASWYRLLQAAGVRHPTAPGGFSCGMCPVQDLLPHPRTPPHL